MLLFGHLEDFVGQGLGFVRVFGLSTVASAVLVSCFLGTTARADSTPITFNNALVDAANRGNRVEVIRLLSDGAYVNSSGLFGITATMRATFNGHHPIVAYLLDNGADPNARDIAQATALHIAARKGHTDIAALLIKRGADVNTQDKDGWTPLMRAASFGHTDTVSLLLTSNANTELTNAWSQTALMVAALHGSQPVVDALLPHSSDTQHLLIAREYAASREHDSVVALFDRFADASAPEPPITNPSPSPLVIPLSLDADTEPPLPLEESEQPLSSEAAPSPSTPSAVDTPQDPDLSTNLSYSPNSIIPPHILDEMEAIEGVLKTTDTGVDATPDAEAFSLATDTALPPSFPPQATMPPPVAEVPVMPPSSPEPSVEVDAAAAAELAARVDAEIVELQEEVPEPAPQLEQLPWHIEPSGPSSHTQPIQQPPAQQQDSYVTTPSLPLVASGTQALDLYTSNTKASFLSLWQQTDTPYAGLYSSIEDMDSTPSQVHGGADVMEARTLPPTASPPHNPDTLAFPIYTFTLDQLIPVNKPFYFSEVATTLDLHNAGFIIKQLHTQFPALLDEHSVHVISPAPGSDTVGHRIHIGPFSSEERAWTFCQTLLAVGRECFPVQTLRLPPPIVQSLGLTPAIALEAPTSSTPTPPPTQPPLTPRDTAKATEPVFTPVPTPDNAVDYLIRIHSFAELPEAHRYANSIKEYEQLADATVRTLRLSSQTHANGFLLGPIHSRFHAHRICEVVEKDGKQCTVLRDVLQPVSTQVSHTSSVAVHYSNAPNASSPHTKSAQASSPVHAQVAPHTPQPEPTAVDASSTATVAVSPSSSYYFGYIGAFAQEQQANYYLDYLFQYHGDFIGANIPQLFAPGSHPHYRLYFGPFSSEATAQQFCSGLQARKISCTAGGQ